ncbi:RpiB/LacA/LacB family sugar-phosphate isomerase [Gallibacterium anatis]|uniref:RpiB/LacA/LacB family sugar-phosphate isomerase n=1 Tax=Gallibacterium TaxID=155493 RepID=UPI0022A8281E|nr:RpiB/LacA/LacB family sugar-phosphate isomerase [Gallibacterium anatis]
MGCRSYSALMSREHNDSNIIAFGAKVVAPEKALALATLWINTQYEGGRHQQRLDMITRFEHHQY